MDKKEVIKTTLKLIHEERLENASVGKIVKSLGISPGVLYYHFKSKNEIFQNTVDYIFDEINKKLNTVKQEKNKKKYLFQLTKTLISFFETRDDILFFLVNARGSSYLDKSIDPLKYLEKYMIVLLNKGCSPKEEKEAKLKLRMFAGSLYEILYKSKLEEKRDLLEEEIEDMCEIYWGKDILRNPEESLVSTVALNLN